MTDFGPAADWQVSDAGSRKRTLGGQPAVTTEIGPTVGWLLSDCFKSKATSFPSQSSPKRRNPSTNSFAKGLYAIRSPGAVRSTVNRRFGKM